MLVGANNQQCCLRRSPDQRGSGIVEDKLQCPAWLRQHRLPHSVDGFPISRVHLAFIHAGFGHGKDPDWGEAWRDRHSVIATSLRAVKRACWAAHCKAARPDGDRPSPTTMLPISLLPLRFNPAGVAPRQ